MSTPRKGIIYSATGRSFVNEAIHSAKSSLRFNAIPHRVYCDKSPIKPVSGIEFVNFTPSGNPYIDKASNIEKTPFNYTIFLDTDTYITDKLDDLFDLLDRFDFAAAHAQGYLKGDDVGPSEAFYDFNSGVLVYRKTQVVARMLSTWLSLMKNPKFPVRADIIDQPPLRRALWNHTDISLYVLGPEYNYRTIFPGRIIGKAKIIHGRSNNYEKLAEYINRNLGLRFFEEFFY